MQQEKRGGARKGAGRPKQKGTIKGIKIYRQIQVDIATIKEIDHRLDVLEKLKVLISEHERKTLEVKHIQKILDENFWIFGEEFRLFSSTEGALKSVLHNYAKEILEIEEPDLDSSPNGEVDLFLTKAENGHEELQRNIIIEIKRASIKLTRDKEVRQIEQYKDQILGQNLCNGENQYWEFFLIGRDYGIEVSELVDSSKNWGEKNRGLILNSRDGRVKIYVRKWSDILEVEWGSKLRYLKEKLKIKASNSEYTNPNDIVNSVLS